jgi:hypothetical protein
VYTRISLDTVLKYRAPVNSGLPSLSTVGSVAFGPRYLSSKLSYEAAAAVALVLALDADEAALVALVLAPDALVEALDA